MAKEEDVAEARKIANPWSRLSAAYRAIGQTDRALDMFARSIELAGTDQAKAAAAQEAAAFADIFARLQERFPDDKSLRLGQAKYMATQHISEGQFQSVVDVLSGILKETPDDIDLLNQRASAFMKLADWKSAEADYARVIELETDDGRRRAAERTRAECLLRMGQFQAGADAMLQEMMLSSEWDRMRDAYNAALLAGNPSVARMVANRFFRTVSGKQDLDANWSGELVRLHTAIPGLVTKENQQRLLEAAAKSGGDWATAYAAAIHYRLGDLEQARALLDTPVQDREFQALAAMLLYDQGDTTRAAGFLKRAEGWLQQESAKDPHSAIPAQVALGHWAANRTVWREAARKLIGPRITELDKLLTKEPDRSAELLERARLLTNVGLVEEALRDLQSLVAQNVTSPESSALHGRILAGLGRDEEALPYLNQAIDSGSLDSDVYAARGTLLLKQRQADAARIDLEKSLELKPNALAAHSLADLLLSESNQWSVLETAEMKSESGATLTRLADDSILVSGLDPDKDSYTMTAAAGLPNITSLRLEAIPDPSLPGSGPGRAPNFVLTDLQLSGSGQFAEFGSAAATYEQQTNEGSYPAEKAVDQDPSSGWAISPMTGQSHTAYFQLKQPITVIAKDSLAIVLHFKSVYPKHVLGRFRLSVSDDPDLFDREEKRLAALKLTDPWVRLAAAYSLMNDQQSLDRLIQTVPSVEAGIAELYFTDKKWDQAIAAYNKLIGDKTTDASLFVKRGEAYFASQQLDRARADWRRAVQLRPELAQSQFDRLRLASRWSEAAEFGLLLIEQKPEDTMLWVQVPPVAVLAEHDTIYPTVCRAILELYRKAPMPENFERAFKACLLKRRAIDMSELPLNLIPTTLDEGKVPDHVRPWIWSTRALLAYRQGDAELAVKSVNQSEQHTSNLSYDYFHAINLAVLAMAQHDLKHPEEARTALNEGQQLLTKLKAGDRYNHDTLIAEILLREAEALIAIPFNEAN
jgi:tetratricopeptide (TPR) repeat protein